MNVMARGTLLHMVLDHEHEVNHVLRLVDYSGAGGDETHKMTDSLSN